MSFCQYQEYPTSWEEFLEAITHDDTEVYCPEFGEWDVGQTHPEGYTDTIFEIKCDRIYGRGTTVKNLKLTNSYFKVTSTQSAGSPRLEFWNALHLINMVVDNTYPKDRLFQCGYRVNTIDGQAVQQHYTICSGSQFSGMISIPSQGASPVELFGQMDMSCSACNFEMIRGSGGSVKTISLGHRQDYCNFKIAVQGFTAVNQDTNSYSGSSYSWFDLYGDDITSLHITLRAHASAFRCGSNAAKTIQAAEQGYPSVLAVNDPSSVTVPANANFLVCTDAQLRDEEWLHDNGFPIGVPDT